MSRARATAIGFGAIALWALLAGLTVAVGPVPPFQLSAICFSIGGAVGLGWTRARGRRLADLAALPGAVWAVGVGGLFGYHFFYFSALRLAPPAEASLIAYLWPLLIVLFSGLLPGERVRAMHVAGALVAFAGAALVLIEPAGPRSAGAWAGYGAAALCALIWSSYSVLSRRLGAAPTDAVAGFCLVVAALSAAAHLVLEETVWPAGAASWAATILLGLGPVGIAFYLWDIGVKRGDIQLLGTAAYAAPLLSTLVLIGAGLVAPRPLLLLAALMITAGALLAATAGRGRAAPGEPAR